MTNIIKMPGARSCSKANDAWLFPIMWIFLFILWWLNSETFRSIYNIVAVPVNIRVCLAAISAVFLLFSCNTGQPEAVQLDLSGNGPEQETLAGTDEPVLRVAIAPVISPRESFSYYQDLFEYMGHRLDMRIEFKQRSSYEEVNEMLARNLVDLAFICTGVYIADSKGMDLLVGPQFNGAPLYQAMVITSRQTDIYSFSEFKGRSFAYTDPLSFTGRFYPDKRIADLGGDPETFFGSVQYTNGHDVSMQMVSRNLVEGASVNGLIYRYVEATHPEITDNLRIIEYSDFFGVPPIVTSLLLPAETHDRLKSLFLGMHLEPEGRLILDHLRIDRFVALEDTMYNSAREVRTH